MIDRPERISGPERRQAISDVSYRRLVGDLKQDGETVCDVIGCETLAICLVGCGDGHPSCEKHAQMADYISPLKAFWDESPDGPAE